VKKSLPTRVLPSTRISIKLKRQAKELLEAVRPASQTPCQKPPRDILALTHRNCVARCSTCARQGARIP